MDSSWQLVGVPIDCSGRFIGVERMPAALREAGLVQRLGVDDLGDLPAAIDDARRDPATGIIGFSSVCTASAIIREGLRAIFQRGEHPLVIGGCCTLLVGVFAALRDHFGDVGLAFVDGHLDFYDGHSSQTGEAADMDLAILTGFGPVGLVDIAGQPPLVHPRNVHIIGYRDAESSRADGSPDPEVLAPEMTFYDADTVHQGNPALIGASAADLLTKKVGRFWLHFDLDVLDETVLPAVDYLMPGGLTWEQVTNLVRPLAHAPALVGADVTIYNPTLDPDGRYARQIVAGLAEIFGG